MAQTKLSTATTEKWAYLFGPGISEGRADLRDLLGGKGANLAEMSNLDLPVPPGFTLTTEACTYFYDHENQYPAGLEDQVHTALSILEQQLDLKFGDSHTPLFLSVRSGARVSMPGMMDTVLNLGLNDKTVEGLAKKSGDPRFAYDSYRRFIQMYSDVVLGLDHYEFENILDTYKRQEGFVQDTDITAEGWQEITEKYLTLVQAEHGNAFPQNPKDQLWGAIGAVFQSWTAPRAVTYRRIHNIPNDWGTAVNIQAMVFGNMGEDCGTGVAFTRDPSTGENLFYGEYLINAQGEDVVAGLRTPHDIKDMQKTMPDIYKQLLDIRNILETHYRDMQDIEFTIQKNKLYMLQTRNGKRTTTAALRIAVDMVNEGLIDKKEAIQRIEPLSLDQLLHPTLDPTAHRNVLTRGLPASPGAASGKIVMDADTAEKRAQKGESVILCRAETSPEDIHGMHAATGILTTRGGMTSHAAVVARGMGRTCVAGAGEISIDYASRTLTIRDQSLKEGDIITIDGTTGEVMRGEVQTIPPELNESFETLMSWADQLRRLKVRANAETAEDAKIACNFGAEGIGLCRTEHMFFNPDRILHVRQMILATTTDERRMALDKLKPEQIKDFVALFKIMKGMPITIRLLDPPLHEFLPHSKTEFEDLAKSTGLPLEKISQRVARLHESNPMLGHRGCRLGITYPEIYEMQIEAIFSAASSVSSSSPSSSSLQNQECHQQDSRLQQNNTPNIEIMIPLVATKKELDNIKNLIERVAADTAPEVNYQVGTMIELPRAALCAGDIAHSAEFFSFGTNDLTQTTFGISRDDSGLFLPDYQQKNIIDKDPFTSLDIEGVGTLIKIAVEQGRKTRPGLKLGICGEHGGDPASIHFCETIGLDYVSCSPYRVPIARLAAAQAALKN